MTGPVRRSVAVIGPFPPPVHGAAAVTERLAGFLAGRPGVRVRRLNIAPDALRRGARYHAQRLGRVALALCRLAGDGFGGDRCAYLSAAGGMGLAYNIILAAAARLLGRKLVIHHHSYAYLVRWDRKMALLAGVAGPAATHVVLCPRMGKTLRARYGVRGPVRVLSNAAFMPPVSPAPDGIPPAVPVTAKSPRALRIGHLSNLCIDKGLDLVLDSARANGDAVGRVVLAGPLWDDHAKRLIDDARAVLGDRLDVRGAVSDHEKQAFFADIDVFLFPSRYANEAEPLVVHEALAAGVPVVAFRRGCIADLVPADCGLVVGPSEDFVAAATKFLDSLSDDRLARMAENCRRAAGQNQRQARLDLDRLLDHMAGPGT